MHRNTSILGSLFAIPAGVSNWKIQCHSFQVYYKYLMRVAHMLDLWESYGLDG